MLFGISGEYNSCIMNIQNLRYFAIVAKLENVSRAAELMHTSQSSISKNIFTLEEELGTKLFDRHGKKLVLNDAGKRFLQSCEARPDGHIDLRRREGQALCVQDLR